MCVFTFQFCLKSVSKKYMITLRNLRFFSHKKGFGHRN